MKSAVFVGLAVVDILYEVDVPRANTKAIARRQEVLCGGPAANAAITCAFLGAPTTLVTAVGTHPMASVIRGDLEEHGVRVVDMTSESREMPSVSSVLVGRDGSRTVISGHATRAQVAAERLDSSVLDDAAVLMVDGHHMECALRAAAEARARGILVVLDGGSWKERTEELLAKTTFAVCSDDFYPPGVDDVIGFALERGVEGVAITRGARSILWATQNERGEIPVPQVAAVDTTAAGDIFHGAFCFQIMQGTGFVESLRFAADVASQSCRYFGSRAWMHHSQQATRKP